MCRYLKAKASVNDLGREESSSSLIQRVKKQVGSASRILPQIRLILERLDSSMYERQLITGVIKEH